MSDPATRMRDAGRSWTEISQRLGVSVPEAKSRVQEDKRARREALSQTQIAEDRNGLRDMCYNNDCDHLRKEHTDDGCTVCGPEHMVYEYWDEPFTGKKLVSETKPDDGRSPSRITAGCNEFVHQKRVALPWYRRPVEEDPQYVDPDTRLTGTNRVDAIILGVQDLRNNWLYGIRVDMPRPSLKVAIRRQRKKLKAGKPVKKHRDRPWKNGY